MNDKQAITLIKNYNKDQASKFKNLDGIDDDLLYYNDHAYALCELAKQYQNQAHADDEVLSLPASSLISAVNLMDVHTCVFSSGIKVDEVIVETLRQQAYRNRRALARIDYVTSCYIEIMKDKPKYTWEPKQLAFV